MENLQDFPEESCTKHSYLAAVIKVWLFGIVN